MMSVVVAAHNRLGALIRLLEQLCRQTVGPSAFEVVIVDDGSSVPVAGALASDYPFAVTIERQVNQGAAVARHRGAQLARGELLVFIDDDMQLPRELLEEHRKLHEVDPEAVVLGRVRPDPELPMPVFERFHASVLERFADDVHAGRVVCRGPNVWSGNLSVMRDRYFRVGGFDSSFDHAEDAELGVRLEKDGAHFIVSDAAYTLHSSDHASLDGWMARAHSYGANDWRIAKKHPDAPHASPWRYFGVVHPVSSSLMALTFVLPQSAHELARTIAGGATIVDSVGFDAVGLAATTLAFGIEYARGLRDEVGGLGRGLTEAARFLAEARVGPPANELFESIRADHETVRRYTAKYSSHECSPADLPRDAVRKIGFQIMVAYRVMRLMRVSGHALAADVMSRAIRHLYGCDIHPDGVLEPGVLIVHGMGLAIAAGTHVASGVILFHNVTLGSSMVTPSKQVGAPALERDVHVGPGATIVGPVTIGAGSKVMGGCFVNASVPPGTVVTRPEAILVRRNHSEAERSATPVGALA